MHERDHEAERDSAELRLVLDRLKESQRELARRIEIIENSRVFRFLRWSARRFGSARRRLGRGLLRTPLHGLYVRLPAAGKAAADYRLWVEREQAEAPPRETCLARIGEFRYRPLFSVLLPVCEPKKEWLEAAIESVRSQVYPNWQLLVADDASSEEWVEGYLARAAGRDRRIRVCRAEARGGIAATLNLAGRQAEGDYVAFLDHDDVLAPSALYWVAESLQNERPDFLYSDEDRLDHAGRRVSPLFKPDWSPDLLTSCMYLNHLLVVSREGLEAAGWLRSEFDGSQDYDLVLRLAETRPLVRHIPRVLYHWRQHPGSTSQNASAKPYAAAAGRRALEEALRRRGADAAVEAGRDLNTFVIRRSVEGTPLISLVICSRTEALLRRCLRTLARKTSWGRREVVVVQHLTGDDERMDRLLARSGAAVVRYPGPFNYALMNNRGARAARGEILVFLNDDAVPLVPDWLQPLIAQCQRPEVGAVGARLVYPSGAIQHAGMAVGLRDGSGHPLRGLFAGRHWDWSRVARNVSAVTGACMAVRHDVFSAMGGFNPQFPVNYNDVDFCLRLREAGYEIIYEPAAVLKHEECRTRMPSVGWEERARWMERWGAKAAAGDPFYNPNLTTSREDASLRLDD